MPISTNGSRMTPDDAKKVTQLLNAIRAEAGLIPLRNEATLNRTTRTLQDHVGQLQQILDLGSLVEQAPLPTGGGDP